MAENDLSLNDTLDQRAESASKPTATSKLGCALLIIVTLVLLVCVALSLAFLINYISLGSDIDSQKSTNEGLKREIENLTKVMNNNTETIRELNKTLNESQNETRTWKEAVEALKKTIKRQEEQIASLQTTNTWLWIGTGTTSGLALAGAAAAIYEYIQIQPRMAEVAKLQPQVQAINEKYKRYFNATWQLLIDEFVFNQPISTWTRVYDSQKNFSRTEFYKNVTGKENTVTVITTDSGATMAAFLSAQWNSSEGEIIDPFAVTMSLHRANFATINNAIGSNASIVSNSTFLQFGEGEIVIYENKTGSAMANKTYTPYWQNGDWTPDTFYAPTRNFNVSRIEVFNITY